MVILPSDIWWRIYLDNTQSNVDVDLVWTDLFDGSPLDLTLVCGDLPLSLAAGGTYDCSFQDPSGALHGLHNNSVTADASYDGFSDSDTDAAYYRGLAPEITIDKQISADGGVSWHDSVEVIVGTELYYRFEVENTGDLPLYNVTVADPTLGGLLCGISELLPGDVYSCGPYGPITAMFTGLDNPEYNTGYTQGCYDVGVCDDDEDTAYYIGLYWAFTPGFWKNHGPDAPSGWNAWDFVSELYQTTTLVEDVFDAYITYNYGLPDDLNLMQALSLRGGRGEKGGAGNLLRAGTASLLNASFHEEGGHPIGADGVFPYYTTYETCMAVEGDDAYCGGTAAQGYFDAHNVTTLVNYALMSEDRQVMLDWAYIFDQINNGIDYIDWDDPYSWP
jgi:hypothetical protein